MKWGETAAFELTSDIYAEARRLRARAERIDLEDDGLVVEHLTSRALLQGRAHGLEQAARMLRNRLHSEVATVWDGLPDDEDDALHWSVPE